MCCEKLILRHAWLNLWDKHMTTGRINQVCIHLTASANKPHSCLFIQACIAGAWTSSATQKPDSRHAHCSIKHDIANVPAVENLWNNRDDSANALENIGRQCTAHHGIQRCWKTARTKQKNEKQKIMARKRGRQKHSLNLNLKTCVSQT